MFSKNFNKLPFEVKDCAFTVIATGLKAHTLSEFYDLLMLIPPESIYHHFWRQTLDTSLAEGSYYNDFSLWAHYDLHDDFLAERLTWINPTDYNDLEKLRADMLQIIKKRMEEQGPEIISIKVLPFNFVKSSIVIFNTGHTINTPKDLVNILPKLTETSLFYHFIDSRRRQSSNQDDFTIWMEDYGEQFTGLIHKLRGIDPYFISLSHLQNKITAVVTNFFLEGQFNE